MISPHDFSRISIPPITADNPAVMKKKNNRSEKMESPYSKRNGERPSQDIDRSRNSLIHHRSYRDLCPVERDLFRNSKTEAGRGFILSLRQRKTVKTCPNGKKENSHQKLLEGKVFFEKNAL